MSKVWSLSGWFIQIIALASEPKMSKKNQGKVASSTREVMI